MEIYYTEVLMSALEGKETDAMEALKAMPSRERLRLFDACESITLWIEELSQSENTVEREQVITHIMLFANGLVAVFDQVGRQMPKYQGEYERVIQALKRDAPNTATWEDFRRIHIGELKGGEI